MKPILLPIYRRALLASLTTLAHLSHGATLLDVTFDDLADGTLAINTTITNTGTGGNGVWSGGNSTVTSGAVDTQTNDGYINFTSGIGLSMNLATTSYTFEAWVDPTNSSGGPFGLFGQINTFTTGDSEWWFRLNTTNELQVLLRDSFGGTQIVYTTTTVAPLISAPGQHHIAWTLDQSTQRITAYVDGVAADGGLSYAALTDSIGEANSRVVVGAYNTTTTNHFDGFANRYRISDTLTIPEPSVALLGSLGAIVLLRRRRD